MIEDKKEFFLGFGMMVAFIVVLAIFFSPVFNKKNGLEYLDDLYNSISKGSAYYIPDVQEKVKPLAGQELALSMNMDDEAQAARMVTVLQKSGAEATAEGKKLTFKGDFGGILTASLADSDLMYHNDGASVTAKYNLSEKQVMADWWRFCRNTVKELNKKEAFKDAALVNDLMTKTIEPAFNYYKVIPKKITSCVGIVVFSLVFYVIYTMWYGYSIMFMFEGWGLKLEH
jgi:hypothetical protein